MDHLLELQETDSAIDRLEARRHELEGGEEVRAARTAMEQTEGRLGELRLALDALSRDQRRLEHDIDSMTQKADAERKRLYDGTIANVKELDALQREIANIDQRRSRAEDELLEMMERREELESRIAVADEETAGARARVEEVAGDSIRELERIDGELRGRRATRDALAPQIDEELLELYDDLRAQKKGVGAAALVDGVCQACHEKLSAMEIDRLKRADGIRRCEYCRRILVFA